MNEQEIAKLINRRQRQLLVHSFIYYRMNENFIDDPTYDSWSKELAELQWKHPEIAANQPLSGLFRDWGTGGNYSGFKLPLEDPEIVAYCSKAHASILNHLKRKGKL